MNWETKEKHSFEKEEDERLDEAEGIFWIGIDVTKEISTTAIVKVFGAKTKEEAEKKARDYFQSHKREFEPDPDIISDDDYWAIEEISCENFDGYDADLEAK
jgi:hypothetical protein